MATGAGTNERQLAVGASSLADPRAAAAAAAEAAAVSEPKLALVFVSPLLDALQALEGVSSVLGEVAIVGCTTVAELSPAGAATGSVVVAVIGGSGIEVATAHTESLTPAPRAAAELGRALERLGDRENRVLIVLADGLAPAKQDLLSALYALSGADTPIVGGCSGNDPRLSRTFQLHGREVYGGGAVVAAIASDGPIAVGIEHGYEVVGGPSVVTEVAGARVIELDGRPAAEVYLEAHRAPALVVADAAVRRAFTHSRPLGVAAPLARPLARFIGDFDVGAGALGCLAEVQRGSLVWFMKGDEESVAAAAEKAVAEVLNGLGSPPVGLLAFDCVARGGILRGQGIEETVRTISERGGGAPFAGFLGYAQIGRLRGLAGLHNQTLVVLGLG